MAYPFGQQQPGSFRARAERIRPWSGLGRRGRGSRGRGFVSGGRSPTERAEPLNKILFEPLEPRYLLSADIFPVDMASLGDDLTLRFDGTDTLEIVDTATDTVKASQAVADTTEVDVTGDGDANGLTIDFTNPFSVPITFSGAGGTDSLTITGGSFDTVTYTGTGSDPDGFSGTIVFDDGGSTTTVTYSGLEPITDTSAATDREIIGTSGADTIQVSDDTGGTDQTTVESTNGTFETITFANPSNSLTIDGGGAGDTITLQGLDSGFSVTLEGGAGDDILDASTFGRSVTLKGEANNDQLTGSSDDDVLIGGTGNDTLTGGLGDDTYVFGAGFGSDTISDAGGTDTLDFSAFAGVLAFDDTGGLKITSGANSVTGIADAEQVIGGNFELTAAVQNALLGVASEISAGSDAPSDGRLSGDVQFDITVEGTTTQVVLAAANTNGTNTDAGTGGGPANSTVADLAADLNSALGAVGLKGVVEAAVVPGTDRLRLRAVNLTDSLSLSNVSNLGELGFSNGDSSDDNGKGLVQLVAWASALAQFGLLGRTLPMVKQVTDEFGDLPVSVGSALDPAEALKKLRADIKAFLDGAGTPTTQGLLSTLNSFDGSGFDDDSAATELDLGAFSTLDIKTAGEGGSGVSLDVRIPGSTPEFLFNVNLEAERTTSFDINLGAEADLLGISFEGNLDLVAKLEALLGLGVTAVGTPNFFLDGGSQLDLEARIAATGLNSALNFGFLDASLDNGSVTLDAGARVDLVPGDDRLDLGELATGSVGSVTTLTETFNNLTTSLPITVSAGGLTVSTQNLFQGAELELILADVFSEAAPQLNAIDDLGGDLSELLDFSNITPTEVLPMIEQFITLLDTLTTSDALDLEIPLSGGRTLGDLLDFGRSFKSTVFDQLISSTDADGDGLPDLTFDSAQELAQDLSSLLPITVQANYDPTRRELTFPFSLSRSLFANASVSTSTPGSDSPVTDEVQTLTVDPTTGSVFTLAFRGDMTSDIPVGASADELDTILERLGAIGGGATPADGDVQVSKSTVGGDDVYTINFQNGLGGQDVEQLAANALPVDFDLNLGDFANVESNSTIGVNATLDFGFTFGIDLVPREAIDVASPIFDNTLPDDGILSGAANFTLKLFNEGTSTPIASFDVAVASDSSNATPRDLLLDVQNAINQQVFAFEQTNDIGLNETADGRLGATQMTLSGGGTSTASGALPASSQLNTNLHFEVIVDGGSPFYGILFAEDTSSNGAAADLAADIEAAVNAALANAGESVTVTAGVTSETNKLTLTASDSSTIDIRFFVSDIVAETGGGRIALSARPTTVQPDPLEPPTVVDRSLQVFVGTSTTTPNPANFNDPALQELGLLSSPTRFDGKLRADTNFTLVVNGTDVSVQVLAADTSGFTGLDQLVTLINNRIDTALAGEGFAAGDVEAFRVTDDGNRIAFRVGSTPSTPIETLSLQPPTDINGDIVTTDGAVIDLGISEEGTPQRAKATEFFFDGRDTDNDGLPDDIDGDGQPDGVSLNASLTLDLSDINASATFGFLGVTATSSSTSEITASAGLSLRDPFDGDTRIRTDDLVRALSSGEFLHDSADVPSPPVPVADRDSTPVPTGVVEGSVTGNVDLDLTLTPQAGPFTLPDATLSLDLNIDDWISRPVLLTGGAEDILGLDGVVVQETDGAVSLGNVVPSNGQLDGDLVFTLKLNSDDPVNVFLRAGDTSGNTSRTDLAGQVETAINDALADSGATQTVIVGVNTSGQLTVDLDGTSGDQLSFDNGPLHVELSGNLDFNAFRELSFDTIVEGLQTLIDVLRQLEGTGAAGDAVVDLLDTPLPLVNRSITDLVSIADRFADFLNELQTNPAASVQRLEALLKEQLGLDAGSPDILSLVFPDDSPDDAVTSAPTLRFDFGIARSASAATPINLDLEDILPDVPLFDGLVGVTASGNLDFGVDASFDLAFGLELDPSSDAPFFLFTDDTGLTVGAQASGRDLDFQAKIGPFGVFVIDGTAEIGGRVNVGIDGDANGRFDLIDLSGSSPSFNLPGLSDVSFDFRNFADTGPAAASATLPIFIGTEDNPFSIGDLGFSVPDLSAFVDQIVSAGSPTLDVNSSGTPGATVFITTPDVSTLIARFTSIPSILDLIRDPSVLVDGLDTVLTTIQDALRGQLLGIELPFVGDALSPAADFIDTSIRDPLLTPLADLLRSVPDPIDAIQGLLFDVFGGLLQDRTGDSTINISDILVTNFVDVPNPENDFLQFDLTIGQSFEVTTDIDFDLGIPGLGLDVNADLVPMLTWSLDLGFGISRSQGFYFITQRPGDDVELEVTADITFGTGASITGQLGFLVLDITDGVVNDQFTDDTGDDVFEQTRLFVEFDVDLQDPNDDGRLTFPELASTPVRDIFVPTATGGADLRVNAEVNFGGLGLDSAILPSIDTDIFLDWDVEAGLSGIEFGAPAVSFRDITLDLGSFISDFAGPILDTLGDVIEPLEWLLGPDGLLNRRLPLISDLAGTKVSFKTLAEALDPNSKITPFLDAIEELFFLIDLVTDAAAEAQSGNIEINFGDLVLSDPNGDVPDGASSITNLEIPDLRSKKTLKNTQVPNQTKKTPNTSGAPKAGAFTTKVTKGEGSLNFALFEPENIFGLLLGRDDVTLVTYDLPALEFQFQYRQEFPIFGPLVAFLTGRVGAGVDLAIGYDTLGLSQFRDTGNFANLINGFFFSDVDLQTGVDIPEAFLRGSIAAGAGLSLGIAKGGVEGGIEAEILFNLSDLDRDGKVRLQEMAANLLANSFNPISVFDVSGTIDFFLRAFVEINLLIKKIKFEKVIADITLFEFDIPFERPSILADKSGSTLTLNVGPNAASRLNGNLNDIGEKIFASSNGSGTVEVWSNQFNVSSSLPQRFTGIDTIIVNGGAGDDEIDLSGVGSEITIEMQGGEGDDTLKGGAGNDVISGDGGDDTILGGAGNDILRGGIGIDHISGNEDDDELFGGAGNDFLFGNGGRDTLDGGLGDDRLEGGAEDDTYVLLGAGSTDTIVDSADGDDTVDFTGFIQNIEFFLFGDGTILAGWGQQGDTDSDGDGVDDFEHQVRTEAGSAVDKVLGGRGDDVFNVFGDSLSDVLLDGQQGSDTYILWGADPGTPPADSTATVNDSGNPWDFDRIIVEGTSGNDDITVTDSEVRFDFTGGTSQVLNYVAPSFDPGSPEDTPLLTVEVRGREGGDEIKVRSTAQTVPVRVAGGAGADTVTIGNSTNGVDDIDGRTLAGLGLGPVVVVGGAGDDTLIVDDSNDDSNNVGTLDQQPVTDEFGRTFDIATVTGLDMVVDLEFEGVETADIRLGKGDDEFTVLNTIGSSPGATLIFGGPGDDFIDIVGAAAGSTLEVEAGSGDDEIDVQSTSVTTTIHGDAVTVITELQGAPADGGDPAVDERQRVTVDALHGFFTLEFDGEETAPIAVGASDTDVRDALGALSSVGGTGNLDVSREVAFTRDGVDIFTYVITFESGKGGQNVPEITSGDDIVDIQSIDGDTSVFGGAGIDTVNVNVDVNTRNRTTTNNIRARLELDGQSGGDQYFVNLHGSADPSFLIKVFDRGASSSGSDRLQIDTTALNDEILMRAGSGGLAFVAMLNSGSDLERVNYDGNLESLVLNTHGGDDFVTLDDNAAVTTINSGEGADRFQIGQLFNSRRDSTEVGIAPEDFFATIETTRGFLSNGISEAATINAGAGNDNFTVFHNLAVLTLNGGDDDDTFIIRAFALAGSQDDLRERTDVSGDAGADLIQYAVNAPVNINGGDGFDTIIVIGTEFGDDFVITEDGVFGAGLNVNFVGIESLKVDGAEGDDRFFILSTNENLTTEIIGGKGTDTFNVNGPTPSVVSNDLLGHSGIITHSIESTDPSFDGVKVEGISTNVADDDEPAIRITQSDGSSRVSENGGTDSYTVVLTRRPDRDVVVKALVPEVPPEEAGSETLRFVGPNAAPDGLSAILTFTKDNWDDPQTVEFEAASDTAAEGTSFGVINHKVESREVITGSNASFIPFIPLVNFDPVFVDGDASFPTDGNGLRGRILEVTSGDLAGETRVILSNTDTELTLDSPLSTFLPIPVSIPSYSIQVDDSIVGLPTNIDGTSFVDSEASFPTLNDGLRGATVEIIRGPGVGQSRLIAGNTASELTLFKPWDPGAEPTSDSVYVIKRYDGLALPSVTVEMFDNDAPGFRIDQTEGGTQVFERNPGDPDPGTDTYEVVLTQAPASGETVSINIDAGDQLNVSDPVLVFDDTNWDAPQLVTVTAIDDADREGFHIGELRHTASSDDPGSGFNDLDPQRIVADIADNDSAGVLITDSNGSTDVIEGGDFGDGVPLTDTYDVVLTKAPAAGETVTVTITAEPTRTSRGQVVTFQEQVEPSTTTLTFDDSDWFTPKTVTVKAIDDVKVDGGDTKVFAPQLDVLTRIKGPLFIEGGFVDENISDLSSFDPVQLPGETNVTGNVLSATDTTVTVEGIDIANFGDDLERFTIRVIAADESEQVRTITANTEVAVGTSVTLTVDESWNTVPDSSSSYVITRFNANFFVDEEAQVDRLTVNNTDSVADNVGTLTGSRLTGLGMAGDTVIGGKRQPGGITYDGLEEVFVNLSLGNDHLTIESTHSGITLVNAGEGDDIIDVLGIAGHTIVNAEAGSDTINVSDTVPLFGGRVDDVKGLLTISGDVPQVTVITQANGSPQQGATPSADEIQRVSVDATGGTFTLELSDSRLQLVAPNPTDTIEVSFDDTTPAVELGFEDGQSGTGTLTAARLPSGFGTNAFQLSDDATVTVTINGVDHELTLLQSNMNGENQAGPGGGPANLTLQDLVDDLNFALTEAGAASAVTASGRKVGAETSDLPFDATAEQVRAALEQALVDAGLVTSGTTNVGVVRDGSSYIISFTGAFGGQNVPLLVTHDLGLTSGLGDTDILNIDDAGDSTDNVGLLTDSTLTGLGMPSVNEIQTLVLDADLGTFTLSFDGDTTGPLAFDASAAAVQAALEGLSGIGDGNIAVVKNDDVYVLRFQGALTDTDVSQISADAGDLLRFGGVPGSATVTTRTDGGAPAAVDETQTVTVDATAGTFTLSLGSESTSEIDFDAGAGAVRLALESLTGVQPGDVDVTRDGDVFTVRFQDKLSGVNLPELSADTTGLTGTVAIATVQDGVKAPAVDDVQTLTVDATGGTYRLQIEFQVPDDTTADPEDFVTLTRTTAPISFDARADTVRRTIQNAIADDQIERFKTDVEVSKFGNVYVIAFEGKLRKANGGNGVGFLVADTTDLAGEVEIATRMDGVNYYGFEELNIDLGSGGDIFNVQGTTAGSGGFAEAGGIAVTNLNLHDGDDRIYVASNADLDLESHDGFEFLTGDLEALAGTLNLDAGSGRHLLMISDEGDVSGDEITITDGFPGDVGLSDTAEIWITGLAQREISYEADRTTGDFFDGVTMWTGSGDDVISVDGTHKRAGERTTTTLNTGLGDDDVTVELDADSDGFFVLNTLGGADVLDRTPDGVGFDVLTALSDDDTVDASASSLPLTIFGGLGNDDIIGGTGTDLIFGDFGRVEYVDPTTDEVIAVHGFGGRGDLISSLIVRPQRLFSVDISIGGDDTLRGLDESDILVGGDGDDTIFGYTETPGAGDGRDVIFGDSGEIDFGDLPGGIVVFEGAVAQGRTLDEDETTGGVDIIEGNDAGDLILAGMAGDTVAGNAGDDTVLGDNGRFDFDVGGGDLRHLVFVESLERTDGGADLIEGNGGEDVLVGGAYGDIVDGDEGDDLVFGDNVSLDRSGARFGDFTNPRFRELSGAVIYDANGEPVVDGTPREDPAATPVWGDYLITLLDHSAADEAAGLSNFGDDYIAGGADADAIFAQLGDDTVQGDGSIDGALVGDPVLARRLADGTLDIVASFEDTSDGDDYIEGNGGDDVVFGNLGQDDIIGGSSSLFSLTTPDLRPDGSDLIFGGAGTDLLRNNAGDTPVNGHARDSDTILGDNGNIFRLLGADGNFLQFNYDQTSAFEDRGTLRIIPRATELLDYTPGGADFDSAAATDIGAADEIHGESGDDFVYGMVGSDVLFGEGQDDDLIGGYGHDWISGGTGTDGILGDDGRIFTSRNGTAEPLYDLAATTETQISTPGNAQQATINIEGELKKVVDLTPFNVDPAGDPLFDPINTAADDIIYGGWGNDFLHGGSGDDAISGAEALPAFYDAPVNPGDILAFDETTGEFADYDENNPLQKIDGFLLNFDASEGPVDPRSFAADPKNTDGDDAIFGDLGNDWLVGGTGIDHSYGGFGNDLLNADDDLETNGGLNDAPDTDPTYEDIAFGGAGRDRLIANTGGDRLIDWLGEFNSYLVPFSPFGAFTISRQVQPQLPEFLYDLSEADGADQTLGSDPARNGEPDGELGLVLQQDDAWGDQRGAPDDPQPGSSQGSKDVLRSAKAMTAASGGSTNGTSLDTPALSAIVDEAIRRLTTGLGLGADVGAALSQVGLQIADLEGAGLGLADGDTITIDVDGAGNGWFVDGTPADDAEFPARGANGAFTATPNSDAYGRVDLLTVMLHEFGHAIGFDHGEGGNFMSASLSTGTRLSSFGNGHGGDGETSGSTSVVFDETRDAFLSFEEARLLRQIGADESLGSGDEDWIVQGLDDDLSEDDEDEAETETGEDEAEADQLAGVETDDEPVEETNGTGEGLDSLLVDWGRRFSGFQATGNLR